MDGRRRGMGHGELGFGRSETMPRIAADSESVLLSQSPSRSVCSSPFVAVGKGLYYTGTQRTRPPSVATFGTSGHLPGTGAGGWRSYGWSQASPQRSLPSTGEVRAQPVYHAAARASGG